jgi:hypothetical protein
MEETAFTNISSTLCHRMRYNFAQDPFYDKCQRKKCVLLGVTFIGGKEGKMRTATARLASYAELGSLVRMDD